MQTLCSIRHVDLLLCWGMYSSEARPREPCLNSCEDAWTSARGRVSQAFSAVAGRGQKQMVLLMHFALLQLPGLPWLLAGVPTCDVLQEGAALVLVPWILTSSSQAIPHLSAASQCSLCWILDVEIKFFSAFF